MRKLASLFKAIGYLLCVCTASSPAFMAKGQQVGAPGARPGFMKDIVIPAHKKITSTTTIPKSNTDTSESRPTDLSNADLHEVDSAGTVISGTPAKQVYIRVKTAPTATDSLHDDSEFEDELDPLVSKYATMMSVEPNDIVNFPLYRFVDQWYGIPYKWGGNDTAGIDCSGFTQRLYGNIFGKDIYRTARQQHRNCERIKHFEDAMEGDLVFFRVRSFRISHVGVYLANGYFVHASRSHGVVVSSLNDRYWHRRYAGCGRISREDRVNAESDFMQ